MRTNDRSTRRGRALGAGRLAWAAALLAAPNKIIAFAGGHSDPSVARVVRVLGVRHAVQGAVEVAWWPKWRRIGAAVDGAHALTGVALAAADPGWRRVALCDTAIATGLAAIGLKE